VRRYRTEIVIPADGVVGLHLPSHLPAGRAIVTVLIVEPEPGDDPASVGDEAHDMEWWEEFGNESEDGDATELGPRLSVLETQI
jgi:hypothetical protein